MGSGRTTDWSKWTPSRGNRELVFGRQALEPLRVPMQSPSHRVGCTLQQLAIGEGLAVDSEDSCTVLAKQLQNEFLSTEGLGWILSLFKEQIHKESQCARMRSGESKWRQEAET